nr:hypothetical protein [Tanacetum cinerariifolium]
MKDLCKAFEKLMKDKFQMSSMGELTFLGLQLQQKQDGIYISQDKYVAKILRKFGLTDRKSASTPIDTEKPLLKDPDGEDVDVHTYRSMIGSLTFLTSSRPDIMSVTNDVVRLQALTDRRKVIITEDTIRQALRLDDADSIDCLPNEEIFAELARMGYEKPSTKLTFYKAFFSAQWKFLIHTILQCMSANRTAWNKFSSSMALAVICLATGRIFNFSKYIFDSLVRNVDSPSKFYMYPRFLQHMINAQITDLSSYTTKYTSPALTQKVFANMRRVGKGFSEVDTLLFEEMLVPQQVQDDIDADVKDEDEDVVEPTPPLPTPATTPPPPQQEIISLPPQVTPTPPPSPHQSPIAPPSSPPQPQPSQTTDISMDLLNTLLETSKGQEIVKKSKLKASGLKRLKKVGTAQRVESSADTAMDDQKDASKYGEIAKLYADEDVTLEEVVAEVTKDADVQGRLEESQAQVYHLDLEHAQKVLSMQDDEAEPAE